MLLYYSRVVFACMIPASLIILYFFGDFIFPDAGSGMGLGGLIVLWFGLCGVGLSLSSILRIWTIEAPAVVEFVEVVLGLLTLVSFSYVAYALFEGLSLSARFLGLSFWVLGLSLTSLTVLVIVELTLSERLSFLGQ